MGLANPDYGKGVFRRRLHWQARAGCVAVALEDSNHGFKLQLHHDGRQITRIEAQPLRHPFTTCPEAVGNVQHIIGLALSDVAAQRARLPQASNCTHLVDMALLAASHATDGANGVDGTNDANSTDDPETAPQRLYDITIDDENTEGLTRARICCDGEQVHDWLIRQHQVVAPADLAGQPVMRGFYHWAVQRFAGMPLEAAQLLQRGYFVAQARRSVYLPIADYPARSDGMPSGACYSYNTGAVERALRIHGSVRNYSHSAERLLQFDPLPAAPQQQAATAADSKDAGHENRQRSTAVPQALQVQVIDTEAQ